MRSGRRAVVRQDCLLVATHSVEPLQHAVTLTRASGGERLRSPQLHHNCDYAAVSPKPKVQEGAADVEARGLALLLQAPMRLGRKKSKKKREIQGGREMEGGETRVSGG